MPSASTCDGNNPVFAICAITGLKPCWTAWRQKVAKSGGSGNVFRIWHLFALNFAICAEKSLRPSL